MHQCKSSALQLLFTQFHRSFESQQLWIWRCGHLDSSEFLVQFQQSRIHRSWHFCIRNLLLVVLSTLIILCEVAKQLPSLILTASVIRDVDDAGDVDRQSNLHRNLGSGHPDPKFSQHMFGIENLMESEGQSRTYSADRLSQFIGCVLIRPRLWRDCPASPIDLAIDGESNVVAGLTEIRLCLVQGHSCRLRDIFPHCCWSPVELEFGENKVAVAPTRSACR